MRIGIDFDNTIVSYDALFFKVAHEAGLVPPNIVQTKVAVRDHLRKIGREDDWTEMQGTVYGGRMAEAIAYPGAFDFMRAAQVQGHELFIVSHKTRYPFRGVQYDLHEAARTWVEASLRDEQGALIPSDRAYFELTKEEKLVRVGVLQCDFFIDDLPEILLASYFPSGVSPILFDPDDIHTDHTSLLRQTSWGSIARHLGVTRV
ncbi:MAG: hypothetical protein Q7T44_11480 [Parvibaculum sp.]|nr:hypothetical protein [Parvibaculum sp.]